MTVIGLTGNIAAGKSTVARLLAERGAEVVDCDELAREVTAPGTPGLAAVVARFGPAVLTPAGSLDRAALAGIVFADPAALAALEGLVHPLVGELKAARVAAARAPAVVVEAIKLIEVGYHLSCDSLWVVTAPAELRVRRLVESRGWTEATARQRVTAQSDEAEKVALADEVIVNDGDEAALASAVAAAWARTV